MTNVSQDSKENFQGIDALKDRDAFKTQTGKLFQTVSIDYNF